MRSVIKHTNTQLADDWNQFATIKNKIKRKIKEAKRKFYKTAFSSKKPQDVWKTIHRVLKPSPKSISFDPEKHNEHYLSTVNRLNGSIPCSS